MCLCLVTAEKVSLTSLAMGDKSELARPSRSQVHPAAHGGPWRAIAQQGLQPDTSASVHPGARQPQPSVVASPESPAILLWASSTPNPFGKGDSGERYSQTYQVEITPTRRGSHPHSSSTSSPPPSIYTPHVPSPCCALHPECPCSLI